MHRGKFGHFSNTFENKFINVLFSLGLKGDDSQEGHAESDLVIEFVMQHLQNKDRNLRKIKTPKKGYGIFCKSVIELSLNLIYSIMMH